MKNTILVISLLLLTGFSLYYYKHQNKKNYDSWLHGDELNAKALAIDNINMCKNVPITNYLKGAKYLLIIFFEPTECGSCLNEKTLWNKISKNKICPVVGITALEDSAEFHEYMIQAGLDFPVFYDPSACIEKNLQIPDTPCKMLISKDGKILLADYVRKTDESKNEFISNLKDFIDEN